MRLRLFPCRQGQYFDKPPSREDKTTLGSCIFCTSLLKNNLVTMRVLYLSYELQHRDWDRAASRCLGRSSGVTIAGYHG